MEPVKNELGALHLLLSAARSDSNKIEGQECFSCRFQEISSSIRTSWEAAAFSNTNEAVLRRYYSYQFKTLQQMIAANGVQFNNFGPGKAELANLTAYLFIYFKAYLSDDILVNYSYLRLPELHEGCRKLISYLENSVLNPEFPQSLIPVLTGFVRNDILIFISVGCVRYIEILVFDLLAVFATADDSDINKLLLDALIRLGFNHHGFFKCLVEGYRKPIINLPVPIQIEHFLEELAGLPVLPDGDDQLRFNPNWPTLSYMLRNWLQEMVIELEQRNEVTLAKESGIFKLPFQLSVAQHACLTRLLYEVGIYDTTVANVIKFNSSNSSTKRQKSISEGSYEMQYYSITQKTAAIILDLLQKMTTSIKQDFFP